MRMHEISHRLPGAVVAGALAAMALAGCSTETEQDTSNKPVCTFEQPGQWSGLPTVFDAKVIAASLHTTLEAVQQGGLGPVACDPGVPIEYFAAGTTLHVNDIPKDLSLSQECLPLVSDVEPKAGALAMHPSVFCPAALQQT